MKVSAVVVNWNTAALLPDCLESIRASRDVDDPELDLEIIVVDNGSTDGSVDLLRECHRDVIVVANDTNQGYQVACNQGSRRATGDVLLHINTDARLLPGTLRTMLGVLATWPRVGIVGPRLEYGDGSFQRWTAGNLPSIATVSGSFLLGDRLCRGKGLWVDEDRTEAGVVGWVSSACLLVRREVFDDIGGLDERFFAYMDDVDLCSRAAERGWTTWYEPSTTAVHLMGGSQEHPGSAASPLAIQSMVRWFRLHHGPRQARSASVVMGLGFVLRAVGHAARAFVRPRTRRAVTDHLRHARIAFQAGSTP